MALRLRIRNPDLTQEERTYISADYTSGVTVTVRDNSSFSANSYAVAGEPGQEQTEQAAVASITGKTTVTLSAGFNFAHPKSCPLYESRYSGISLERSSDSGATWTVVSGSPFTLRWDGIDEFGKISTLVEDGVGASSYDYRWRFYNAATAGYSVYSGTLPGTGLDRNTAGFVFGKVRRNKIAQGIPDAVLYQYINDLQDTVYEEMPKAWWFSKEGDSIAIEEDVYRYSISGNWSNFLSMQYMLYNYVSGSTSTVYPLTFVTQLEFWDLKADQNQSSDDSAVRWSLLPPDSSSAKGYIGIDPTPAADGACLLKPVYFFELTNIDSFEDTLVIPKPKIYEDYILHRINDDIKGDATNAEKYLLKVNSGLVALKKRTKRQQGQREWRRYRGNRGYSRLFGGPGGMSNDARRETYW